MNTYIHRQVHTQMHMHMHTRTHTHTHAHIIEHYHITEHKDIIFNNYLIIKYCQYVNKRLTDRPFITVLNPTFVSV